MTARWSVCAAALAALALLAPPAAGAATSAPALGLPAPLLAHVPPPIRAKIRIAPVAAKRAAQPIFELQGHDGYRVLVAGVGDAVGIQVRRGGRRSPITVYLARGVVTSRRLQASFGRYGSIDMRFDPAPARSRPQARGGRCRLLVTHPGVFVGDLRFRGEDDYLSLHAHRGKGMVVERTPSCRTPGSRGRRRAGSAARPQAADFLSAEPDYLVASWRRGVSAASFSAIGFADRTLFLASAEQSEGAIAKLHLAYAVAQTKAAFAIDGPLTFARVRPGAPFEGSGTYRAAPDGSTTWQGALSLNFPGAPGFSFTGQPFKVELEASF